MPARSVADIKRAIAELNQEEFEGLRLWFEEYAGPSAFDLRIAADLSAGRLDKAIERALADGKRSRIRPT